MRELFKERDRLCKERWEERFSLPEWTTEPLLEVGLTRDELAAATADPMAGKERLYLIEEAIADIDRQLSMIVVRASSGRAGERASLASVIQLAVQELQALRSGDDPAFSRARLIARLLELASSHLSPSARRLDCLQATRLTA